MQPTSVQGIFPRKFLSKIGRQGRFVAVLMATTILGSLAFAMPGFADEASDIQSLKDENAALRARLDKMQKAIDALMSRPAAGGGASAAQVNAAQAAAAEAAAAKAEAQAAAAQAQATAATAQAQAAAQQAAAQQAAAKDKPFLARKGDKGLTFTTPGGEITAYGQLDISIDDITKGLDGKSVGGVGPIGRVGWQPDVSTNISYIGVRGFQNLGDQPFKLVYQLETQIDIAATSGIGESGSQESNQVKGALTSRNSYVGLSSPDWGTIDIGKTDAPYKQSTARMNAFNGMIGDYAAVMGNTGGDNRVEFGTRLDHSIWYESPNWSGLKFNLLWSPGQNRASNSDNLASGESDCTGGNIPGSGGIFAISGAFACNDGSFSDAVSTSLTYENDGFYAVAAYERHFKVNRQSDITGLYVSAPPLLYNQDVADEDAWKIGLQYVSAETGTTVSGIFEDLHRYVPSDLAWQNERQRIGWWLAVTQKVYGNDTINVGWAHAGQTPGDPCQHNDCLIAAPLGTIFNSGTAGPDVDNSANMVTVAYKHDLGDSLTVYLDWAAEFNGNYAHYDLGAGGRAVTTDCHDAFSATGDEFSTPHCWTGGQLMGVSVGLNYKF